MAATKKKSSAAKAAEAAYPQGSSVCVYVPDGLLLNMRSKASMTGDIIAQLPNGTALTVVGGATKGFLQVMTADGTCGWCRAEYLSV